MFREVKIDGYRGLHGVVLPELGRLNIIIGENNSGKTSILEAIQLLDGTNVLENVISIARKREAPLLTGRNRLHPFDILLYSFPMQDGNRKEIFVSAQSDAYGLFTVGVRGELTKKYFYPEEKSRQKLDDYELYFADEDFIRVLEGDYIFENDDVKVYDRYHFNETDNISQITRGSDNKKASGVTKVRKHRILYISPMDIYTNRIISASLYKGMLVEEKKRLLQLLKMFDERIIGIETGIQYGYPVPLIEMEDCGLVPISVFGDGLKKVLTLASAVIKMRGGVLLIDEFETGIHKRALVQVAKWLAAVTERYDVQVFLTTHSSDAIDALVWAKDRSELYNINAYRLEHYKSNVYVRKYQGMDLYDLVRNHGMDIL